MLTPKYIYLDVILYQITSSKGEYADLNICKSGQTAEYQNNFTLPNKKTTGIVFVENCIVVRELTES